MVMPVWQKCPKCGNRFLGSDCIGGSCGCDYADQLNREAARRQMEGTMSDEAIWRRKAERERDSAREQLAAAKAENERLTKALTVQGEDRAHFETSLRNIIAAERAAKEAALDALRKEQDAFNAEVRELQDINARLLRERDAVLAEVQRLDRELIKERLAAKHALWFRRERDAAVQAKERAEADAAILLDAMRDITEVANVHDAVEIARDQLHARQAGAALLEELHQLRKDAGYDGHPNSRAALAQQPDQRKDG